MCDSHSSILRASLVYWNPSLEAWTRHRSTICRVIYTRQWDQASLHPVLVTVTLPSRHLKRKKWKNCHIIAFLLASENIVRDSSELLKIHKDVNKAKQTKKEEEEESRNVNTHQTQWIVATIFTKRKDPSCSISF